MLNHYAPLVHRVLSLKFLVCVLTTVFLGFCVCIITPRAAQYYKPIINSKSTDYQFPASVLSSKQTVPLSVVVPCVGEDLAFLRTFLESVAKQTVYPQDLILVLNLNKNDGFEEGRLDLWNSTHQVEIQRIIQLLEDEETKNLKIKNISSNRQPVQKSLSEIPKVSILKRNGRRQTGDNRVFGSKESASDLISFFDVDDYMHPQRVEYLYRTFHENPELEALIHGYRRVSFYNLNSEISNFSHPLPYLDEMNQTFPKWPYELLHERLPVSRFRGGEPFNGNSWWCFPLFMNLEGYDESKAPASNGWLTVKKKVLETIPYPASNHGEDSLYNYRLLRNKVKFNMLTIVLALYMSH